ncbi:MAG: AAA family ATPase, partial [Bacteroidales bacterium]
MEIILPKKFGDSRELKLKDTNNLVIVGANGAGKSLFGDEIEHRYSDKTFKISALNTVCAIDHGKPPRPNSVGAEYDRLFGENSHITANTEFGQLFALLQREEMQNLIKYKEDISRGRGTTLQQSKLDKTQTVWERIFPHSKIVRKCEQLEIIPDSSKNSYNAMEMSHGEKVVFYLIASSLVAKPDSIIIVDEPEMHLHPSMTSSLWNDIETERPDCTFIYLTHDLNFAVSRTGKRIWVKRYDADTHSFDYEFIENLDNLPEDIYLELLGARKPVLFIEGDSVSSIDCKLYPLVFTDYTVKPLGSCSKVIEVTKAFSEMKNFHMLESRGIVDRDRRTSHETEYLRAKNIYVPEVAEVE